MPYKDPEERKRYVHQYNKTYWQNNAAKCRSGWLKRKYGLTVDALQTMFMHQSGSCAICNSEFENWNELAVDHDHSTGQMRELICKKHNLVLGLCNDDPNILMNAARYLLRHKNL